MTSTISGFEHLSGAEWQNLCIRVLHEHHGGGQLIEVPDQDRGDGGLEAFSVDGSVYQCYAPENEPLDPARRYQKQRNKMTDDVGKFIRNQDKIKKIVPPDYKARCWILLVPLITTKQILEHAHVQTVRVRAECLPYVHESVVVMAHTLRSYERAKNAVVARQLDRLNLPSIPSANFHEINDPLIDVMRTKLSRTSGFSDPEKRGRFVDRLLMNFVVGKEQRAWVLDHYSELGNELDDRLSDLEARLEVHYRLDRPDPDRLLASILRDTESIVRDLLNVRTSQGRVVAEGQVAEWLMECPLEF